MALLAYECRQDVDAFVKNYTSKIENKSLAKCPNQGSNEG